MIATVSGTVAIIAILCYVVYPKSVIRTELCYFFPNYIITVLFWRLAATEISP